MKLDAYSLNLPPKIALELGRGSVLVTPLGILSIALLITLDLGEIAICSPRRSRSLILLLEEHTSDNLTQTLAHPICSSCVEATFYTVLLACFKSEILACSGCFTHSSVILIN